MTRRHNPGPLSPGAARAVAAKGLQPLSTSRVVSCLRYRLALPVWTDLVVQIATRAAGRIAAVGEAAPAQHSTG